MTRKAKELVQRFVEMVCMFDLGNPSFGDQAYEVLQIYKNNKMQNILRIPVNVLFINYCSPLHLSGKTLY